MKRIADASKLLTKAVILALLLTACSPFPVDNESVQAPPATPREEALPQAPSGEKLPFDLTSVIDLARHGKIPQTSFVLVKTTMDEVEQAWGQPDKLDQVGGIWYAEAENIRKNVMDNVRNGDIILMHSNEDKSETAKAVPLIISGLQQQGFEIVGLDTLLGVKPYK